MVANQQVKQITCYINVDLNLANLFQHQREWPGQAVGSGDAAVPGISAGHWSQSGRGEVSQQTQGVLSSSHKALWVQVLVILIQSLTYITLNLH